MAAGAQAPRSQQAQSKGQAVRELVETGIYREHRKDCSGKGRCDCMYQVRVRQGGRGSKYTVETVKNLTTAKDRRGELERERRFRRDHERGAHTFSTDGCPVCRGNREASNRERPTLHTYAREHIERYAGSGRRGYREETRDDDRRLLDRYALTYFDAAKLLDEIKPRDVAEFLGWLTKRPSRRGGTLSDSSIHNAFEPLSAVLATARREGLIEHDPSTGAVLPHRPKVEEDDDGIRPFPADTMELVVSLVRPEHRLLFELLAATGVRRSELLAFLGRDLHLNGERPYVSIRRRVRRQVGNGLVVGPLKSKYARRDLPIPLALADKLTALARAPHELVFQSGAGTLLDPDNLHERVLRPACAEAGVEWAGFHTFRHTVASRLFAQGRNVVQVQRWLGHHSPSFTLDTYVHLLNDDLAEPLGSTPVSREGPETTTDKTLADLEAALESQTTTNDHAT